MRQNVERAFDLVMKRWGIFWRPLACSYNRWRLIIQVTFALHNICLRESIQIKKPFYKDDSPDIEKEAIIDYEGLNSPEDCEDEKIKRDTRRRDVLTAIIRENNWICPHS